MNDVTGNCNFFIMFENLVVDLYSNCWLSMRCTHIRRTGSDRGPALAAVGLWSATDIERHLSKFSQLQKDFFFYSISVLTHLSLCQSTMFLKVFLAILIVKTWPFYFLYLRFLFVKSFLCLLNVLSKKSQAFEWCTLNSGAPSWIIEIPYRDIKPNFTKSWQLLVSLVIHIQTCAIFLINTKIMRHHFNGLKKIIGHRF